LTILFGQFIAFDLTRKEGSTMSLFKSFAMQGEINPSAQVVEGLQLEVVMGSRAFGVSNDASDYDIYGFYIPVLADLESVEPFLVLDVFDRQQGSEGVSHDFKIHTIVDFFQCCIKGKSQVLETLFAPEANVLFQSAAAKLIKDNRQLFLHQGVCREFERFALKQASGMEQVCVEKNASDQERWRHLNPKRQEYIRKYGYDIKAGYHAVRLMLEADHLLCEGELSLQRFSKLLRW
jgi:uncharacterized protein